MNTTLNDAQVSVILLRVQAGPTNGTISRNGPGEFFWNHFQLRIFLQ